MSNLVGKSLGHYHIREEIDRGGMAIVYKAFDKNLERVVALKIINREKFGSAAMDGILQRFKREAKALARLSHPNIVKVMDFGDEGGTPYLVMEYLPGGTLKEKKQGKPMHWQNAAKLLLPICRALGHAHEAGIIHRDIKPSNILLSQSGELMLTDFGIAKIIAGDETTVDLTGTGVGIGTPEYMAPEQGYGKADIRADIYSLGIIFYQMVTGRLPYKADTPMGVMLKKNTEPPPSPKRFVPDLPDWVEIAMIKALTREPQDRYQNMDEFTSALEKIASDIPIIETPPTNRRRAFIILAIILGAAGLAGGGYALFERLSENSSSGETTVSVESAQATIPAVIDSPIVDAFTEAPTSSPVSTWQQGKIVYVVRDGSDAFSLYMLDLAQGGVPELLLTPDNPTQNRFYAPWLSADGSKLAFDDYFLRQMFIWDFTLSDDPWEAGECSSPSFSPDGNQVICYIRGGADYFPVYDTNNGSLSNQVYHDKIGAVLPAWSPDGSEIAFAVLEEGRGEASVWKMDIGGGNPLPLATEAYEDYAPSWSPDSEWIAYQSTLTSDVSQVWMMRRDGSERTQITFNGGDIWSRGPCFSPDGQWLAFVSSQNGTTGADFGEVFVASLLTGEIRQVTNTGGSVLDWRVTWSK